MAKDRERSPEAPRGRRGRLGSPRGRLFVALDLPDDVRGEIVGWQGRELGDPSLRPVPPENLHVTLVFLGWRAEKDFERIAREALAEPQPAPGFELLPEPVGRPRGRRPGLFALEGRSPETERLQAGIAGRLESAGLYEPEKRPFWPHVTVARVRPERREGEAGKGRRRRGRPAHVERWPGPLGRTPVRFRPTRLVVFRSHMHPSGARYEPMAELELPTAR
jgi:RNA 2',3'-cyclic 3'-phosphodiesterase